MNQRKYLEDLLDCYQKELNYISDSGNEFVKKYPHIGKNINWIDNKSSDPNIQKLLESFAFMSASLNLRMEKNNSDLTNNLVKSLLPHISLALPSMTIMNLSCEEGFNAYGKVIKRGTEIYSNRNSNKIIFQTASDVEMLPIEINLIDFIEIRKSNISNHNIDSNWALRIRLSNIANRYIDSVKFKKIRFYINQDKVEQGSLYEMVFASDNKKVFVSEDGERYRLSAKSESISQIGFDEDILKYDFSDPKFKVLLEYISFRQKFMFFDIFIDNCVAKRDLEIVIPISSEYSIGDKNIDSNVLKLNCTPVINLFRKKSEPIEVNYKDDKYKVIASRGSEKTISVHSVNEVYSTDNDIKYLPYLSFSNNDIDDNIRFWSSESEGSGSDDVFLKLTDWDLEKNITKLNNKDNFNDVIIADIYCTNKNVLNRIDQYSKFLIDDNIQDAYFYSIIEPTKESEFPPDHRFQLAALSHLIADHKGLMHNVSKEKTNLVGGVECLKNLIKLYEEVISNSFNISSSISEIKVHTGLGSESHCGNRYFVPKTIITITLDDQSTYNTFLLGKILHEVFKHSADFNNQVETMILRKSDKTVWKKYYD